MAERMTSQKVLDTLATRKPFDWADTAYHATLTDSQKKYLLDLPLFVAEKGFTPMTEFDVRDQHGLKYRMPKRFVVRTEDNEFYYVNTEGYSYCRYALRVYAFTFDWSEKVVTPTLKAPFLFEDKVGDNSIVTDEKKPISVEVNSPSADRLVLASKALLCYLEYKEYPEGTKLLSKMLAEALNEYQNNE
jgi:hypothetical protein